MAAYHRAMALEVCVSGPKELGTFGTGNLYPVLMTLEGICRKKATPPTAEEE